MSLRLIYKNLKKPYFRAMINVARIFLIVAVSWFVSPHLYAADAVATLRGVVRDPKGQPLQGAELRIQGSDANKIGKVHTDAQGRYSYPGLETGEYSVTLVVAGVTKASISNVKTQTGEVQTLNFDLQKGAAAKPFTKGKHYVWVPSQTGTHLGTWMEVENDGKLMASGMAERLNNQGNVLARQIQSNSAAMPNSSGK
jgi:protocatechuate 3,4-dioxygenase beta subunit